MLLGFNEKLEPEISPDLAERRQKREALLEMKHKLGKDIATHRKIQKRIARKDGEIHHETQSCPACVLI